MKTIYCKRNSILKIAVLAAAGSVLFSCSRQPFEKIDFNPPPEKLKEMEIPSQPGIDGIIITGPRQILPVFKIIPMRSEKVIDFHTLDPNLNIEVTAEISTDGHLSVVNCQDSGFPQAAEYICSALGSWTYTNFKTGTIRFWFDLASQGRRLKIDTSGLRINRAATSLTTIPDGLLYMIDGLKPGDLGYIKF